MTQQQKTHIQQQNSDDDSEEEREDVKPLEKGAAIRKMQLLA